jgi:CBS domain-containing protein
MVKYNLRARDVMSVELATILEDATVAEAAQLMRLEGVRSLIVERHNEQDAYGIITFSDICNQVLAGGRDPSVVQVHEIMTKPIVVIDPMLEVKYVARLFKQVGISHLPVVDQGKLAGMVSMTDLVTELIPEPE